MAKTTIKSINAVSPVDTKNGVKYKYSLTLEDGVSGKTTLENSLDLYKVGQEIEYEITQDEYKNIKVKKEGKGGGFGGGPKTDYKKEAVFVALQEATKYRQHRGGRDTDEVIALADKFLLRLHKQLDDCK